MKLGNEGPSVLRVALGAPAVVRYAHDADEVGAMRADARRLVAAIESFLAQAVEP